MGVQTTAANGGPSPADHLGDYANAFQVGRALAATSSPPPSGIATNAITGNFVIDAAQRAPAARRAEILGAIGVGLSGVPYPQRASVLAHMAPALAAQGVPTDVIANFDPTDDALSAAIKQTRAVSLDLSTR